MSTSTSPNENGILMIEKELVRCKDCEYHHEAHYEEDGEKPIIKHKCKLLKGYQFSENHYCGFARRKEE